jgi:hypothetical protein
VRVRRSGPKRVFCPIRDLSHVDLTLQERYIAKSYQSLKHDLKHSIALFSNTEIGIDSVLRLMNNSVAKSFISLLFQSEEIKEELT